MLQQQLFMSIFKKLTLFLLIRLRFFFNPLFNPIPKPYRGQLTKCVIKLAFESLQSICPLEPHFFENQLMRVERKSFGDLEKSLFIVKQRYSSSHLVRLQLVNPECPNVMSWKRLFWLYYIPNQF